MSCSVTGCDRTVHGLGYCRTHHARLQRSGDVQANKPIGSIVRTPATPLANRFWPRVDRSGGPAACWPWMGSRTPSGYGQIHTGETETTNHMTRTHRVAWELQNGPVPAGLHVLHACDNPPCCNPAHLSVGTNDDNVADRVAKGRSAKGRYQPVAARMRSAGWQENELRFAWGDR